MSLQFLYLRAGRVRSLFLLGSQAVPTNMPPPRKLPHRSWAASIPTILTHSALNVLLLPSPTPGLMPGLAGSYLCSPLERFLGSVIMRRHLQRIIQQETVPIGLKFLIPLSSCWKAKLHFSPTFSMHGSRNCTFGNHVFNCLEAY